MWAVFLLLLVAVAQGPTSTSAEIQNEVADMLVEEDTLDNHIEADLDFDRKKRPKPGKKKPSKKPSKKPITSKPATGSGTVPKPVKPGKKPPKKKPGKKKPGKRPTKPKPSTGTGSGSGTVPNPVKPGKKPSKKPGKKPGKKPAKKPGKKPSKKPSGKPGPGGVKLNAWVAAVVSKLTAKMTETKMDPVTFPDLSVSYSKSVSLGFTSTTLSGSAALQDGSFSGYSSFAPTDGVNWNVTSEKLVLWTQLRKDSASATYKGTADLTGVPKVSIDAAATVPHLQIYMSAEIALKNGGILQLTDLKVTDMGDVSVAVDGLGPLSWVLGKVVSEMSSKVKSEVVKLVEGPLKEAIQAVFNELSGNLPNLRV